MELPEYPESDESDLPAFEEEGKLAEEAELAINTEAECARFFLLRLMDRAFREDPEVGYPAFRKLIQLFSDQLARFETMCLYNHEVCEHLAPQLEMWPSLYHAHPELRHITEERLRRFGLGKAAWINTSGKSFSFGTPAVKIVATLLEVTQSARGYAYPTYLRAMAVGLIGPTDDAEQVRFDRWKDEVAPALPDFNRDTWKEWAERTHELFELLYGREYQDHPELREIAKQVTETDKKGAISRGRQRSAIKKSLQQAWKAMSAFAVNKD